MRIKSLAQGNNILLPGFEPSSSVSKTDILANRPMCSNKILSKHLLYTILVKGRNFASSRLCNRVGVPAAPILASMETLVNYTAIKI